MSANSEILGNKGTKHSFDFEGKTYCLSYIDKKLRDAFEKHLFKRDRQLEKFIHEEDGTSETEYQQRLTSLNAKFREGGYALESKGGLAYINTSSGQLFFASLVCGCGEDEMIRILSTMGSEVSTLLKLVIDESIPTVKAKAPPAAGTPDPNLMVPVA